jgi:hypothetical protein
MHESLQSAYKSSHSTETALLRVQNDLLSAMDNRKASFLVLLDLSAAFDTVDHSILIERMTTRLRIGGKVLMWCMSYLENRTQRVYIDDALSEVVHLFFGVPQGSVLGPLLYLIYTLPIGDIIRRHGLLYHLYADDTQLYVSFDVSDPSSMDSAKARVLDCVAEIGSWMTLNKLKLNTDKTEIIVLTSAFNREHLSVGDLLVGGANVRPSNCVRNLGVLFDSHLSMDKHITKVCSTAFYHLRNISRIRNVLTTEAAISLTHAFITSRIDFCNSLLSGVPKASIAKLQRVQNMAAKMITKTRKYDHVTPILKSLHWLPVEYRIKFKVLLLTFRILHGLAPNYLADLMSARAPGRQLRSSNITILDVPRTNLKSAGDRSFSHQSSVLWNQLPSDIRAIQKLSTFKTKLKTHLFILAFDPV